MRKIDTNNDIFLAAMFAREGFHGQEVPTRGSPILWHWTGTSPYIEINVELNTKLASVE